MNSLVVLAVILAFFAAFATAAADLTGSKQYVLSMQKCRGSDLFTLHGLWPEYGMNCGNKFDINALKPIRPDLEKYWLSCPEFNKGNEPFWEHEYTKHGSCMKNLTQIDYFTLGLELRDKYVQHCAGDKLRGECRLCLDANLELC